MKEQSSDDRTWKGERRAREINWRRNAIRVVWQEKIGSVLWEPNKGRKDSLTLEKVKVRVTSLSRVRLFATPWTVVYQAPPSVGFSRQEDWSGWPFPSPALNVKASTMNLHRVLRSLHEEPCIEKNGVQERYLFLLIFSVF